MDILTIDTEEFFTYTYTMPRRSQRNLDRANRAAVFHSGVCLSVGSEDSEKDELTVEDPPSPGPSVPNGKFVILLLAKIIQTNHQV